MRSFLFLILAVSLAWVGRAFRCKFSKKLSKNRISKISGYGSSSILRISSSSSSNEQNDNDKDDKNILRQRTDVVCVGEALLDCIANEAARGKSVNDIVESGDWEAFPGGAPANVACALTNLGVRSIFAGAVGDDDAGKALMKVFRSRLVETLVSINDKPTRRVMVTRDATTGDRTFAGFAEGRDSKDFADCYYTPPVDVEWIANCATLAVVTGTLGLAHGPTAKVLCDLAKVMKAKKQDAVSGNSPLFVVDLNVRDVFWENSITPAEIIKAFAFGADIIKLTDVEAEWALGITPERALADPALVASRYYLKISNLYKTLRSIYAAIANRLRIDKSDFLTQRLLGIYALTSNQLRND
jgi:sugar/nucleoside kinase (ribokinase family)